MLEYINILSDQMKTFTFTNMYIFNDTRTPVVNA